MSEKSHKGMIGVYQIRNTVTGDIYIGASLSFGNRFKQDFSLLVQGKHPHTELQSHWSQYDPTVFEFSILESLSHKSMLQSAYTKWLAKTDAYALTPMVPLPYSLSGHVSISRDLKNEIRMLDLGTFDASVRELIDSYASSLNTQDE
ncbi:hypothetical protein CL635_03200 [bacterium]|jgi:hypothetical protein|nr:hypothetical protein [bacterium]|tara:strand:+ start:11761 stop:12201 length:441 start_codon:yes stop_codon:yes gene_type:complete